MRLGLEHMRLCNNHVSAQLSRQRRIISYVMRMAVNNWKNNPTIFRKPDMYAAILVQSASRPVASEETAKKRPIRTKANMNRVR
jgi:hypothetical protein